MLPQQPEENGPPAMRASDADRTLVVDLLRTACADGRITLDEFSERVGQVYAARTMPELDAVTADLPVPPPSTSPSVPPGAVAQPTADTARRRPAVRHMFGIMSGSHQKGRWRPASQLHALSIMGGCVIDLREAEIDGPEVVINAIAIMGGVHVIVPEGIDVQMTGLSIMGGRTCRIKDVPPLPGTPVVRIQALAIMGGVHAESRPSRAETKALRDQKREDRRKHRAEMRERFVPPIPPIPPIPQVHIPNVDIPQMWPPPPVTEDVKPPRSLADHDGTVTVLFTDIVGFTGITERLGDIRAQEVLRAHNQLIRNEIGECGGHEVKVQGDSFMVAFPGAARALRCAVRIQRKLEEYGEEHPEQPVRVRMGLHTGEAIKEDDDLFGRTVIVASRIAGAAEGGEILVSSLLMQLTESSGEFIFDEGQTVALKGLSQQWTLHAVKWQGAD